MTAHLTFLLSKDPTTSRGGDIAMYEVMRAAVESWADVGVICLSDDVATRDDGVVRVAKPPVSASRLVARSVRRGRSLVHTRFDVDDLLPAIEDQETDGFVAVHSYMAETFLRSSRHGAVPLHVSREVSEAKVWAESARPGARLEVPRIERDELRIARAATSVATYDASDAEQLAAHGVQAHRIPVVMTPTRQARVAESGPRLIFLGDRRWPPNAAAALQAVRLWPRISDGIDGAELLLVGHVGESTPDELPPGVRNLGFVEHLGAVMGTARGLLAPVDVGGGVRVKILDAASHGLPVVGTTAAVGDLTEQLGLEPYDGEAFVERCRALLLDADLAAEAGDALYRRNAMQWDRRVTQHAVERWLGREEAVS